MVTDGCRGVLVTTLSRSRERSMQQHRPLRAHQVCFSRSPRACAWARGDQEVSGRSGRSGQDHKPRSGASGGRWVAMDDDTQPVSRALRVLEQAKGGAGRQAGRSTAGRGGKSQDKGRNGSSSSSSTLVTAAFGLWRAADGGVGQSSQPGERDERRQQPERVYSLHETLIMVLLAVWVGGVVHQRSSSSSSVQQCLRSYRSPSLPPRQVPRVCTANESFNRCTIPMGNDDNKALIPGTNYNGYNGPSACYIMAHPNTY